MKGRNEQEVPELIEFARRKRLDISFIEEMPLGEISEHDRGLALCSSDEVRTLIRQHHDLLPTTDDTGGPSRYYRMPDSPVRVGFISPHSHTFCGDCNRVRVTCTGELFMCLGQEDNADLRAPLRAHPDDNEPLREAIRAAISRKPKGHDFDYSRQKVAGQMSRHMSHTGG